MFAPQTRALLAAASLLVSTTALANLPTHAVVVSGELNPGHAPFRTFRNGTQIAINDAGQILFEGHDESDGNLWLAQPDGSLGILEAGPNDTLYVRVLDMLPHLKEYEDKGPLWIRRRRVPLTAEQSAQLTDFVIALNVDLMVKIARLSDLPGHFYKPGEGVGYRFCRAESDDPTESQRD